MKISKQFTTVTPFSKYLAMVLFITIPFITFFIGLKYGKIKEQSIQKIVSIKKTTTDNQDPRDRSFYKFLNSFSTYKKMGFSISYTCFDTKTIPNIIQFNTIQKTLSIEKRIIKTACMNPQKDRILVESIKKQDENDYDPNFNLDMYHFYEPQDIPTNFNVDFVYREPADNAKRVFKLVDWTSNNDVIYSIFETSPQYLVFTYKYNPTIGEQDLEGEVVFNPILEVCSIRIAMGTSKRLFSYCDTFDESQKSQYINENDIP